MPWGIYPREEWTVLLLVTIAVVPLFLVPYARAEDIHQLARRRCPLTNHLRSLEFGLYRDLPGRRRGASGIGHLVVEKAAQDALALPV